MSIDDVEGKTKEYSESRAVLAARVERLESLVNRLKKRYLPGIKSAVSTTLDRRALLFSVIDSNRTLFSKQRTRIFHGVRVGIVKGKGAVSFNDAAQVAKLIRKHLPGDFDRLVKTTERPIKKALQTLTAQQLKSIGCTLVATGDEVLIKPADSDVDKLVEALLSSGAEDTRTEG